MSSAIHIETAFKAMAMMAACLFFLTVFGLTSSFFGGSLSFSAYIQYAVYSFVGYGLSPFLLSGLIFAYGHRFS